MTAASSQPTPRPAPTPPPQSPVHVPSAAAMRACFDAAPSSAVGIEEEVMVLDPQTLELSASGPELLSRLGGDPRFKLELPASQIEIVTPPLFTLSDTRGALRRARQDLAAAAEGAFALAAAGVHPSSPGRGKLNRLPRYEPIVERYGPLAARQLVCALQVHVSIRGSERVLAVYNAARSYLPLLAALAANAPFYEGRDSGMASVRPKLAGLLPRQGVPPAIESWEHYEGMLAWGARARTTATPQTWWWELRPHPGFGTLEVRVPDAQTTVDEAIAVAGVVHSLMNWLAIRHDAGEQLEHVPGWRIEENRWFACREGVEGFMADLYTGELRPTRQWLLELLEELSSVAERLGCDEEVKQAREMVGCNGAIGQRRAGGGARDATRWLAERFLQ